MNTTTKTLRRSTLTLLLGLVGAVALPSVTHATAPSTNETTPIAAENNCTPKSTIVLEIDAATGDIYLVDDTGGLTLTNSEIDVYVGTLSTLLVELRYTSSEWEVDVSPLGEATETYQTSGGTLRYVSMNSIDEYAYSSTELTGMSTMMNMTPVVPTVVIRPKKDCPPST